MCAGAESNVGIHKHILHAHRTFTPEDKGALAVLRVTLCGNVVSFIFEKIY